MSRTNGVVRSLKGFASKSARRIRSRLLALVPVATIISVSEIPAQASVPCFAPENRYGLDSVPSLLIGRLTGGDLDGDGDQDMVVFNRNGVSILKNSGNGTFSPPVFDTLFTLTSIRPGGDVADIDGDGDLDLVAASFRNGLAVVPNFGDGTFDSTLLVGSRVSNGEFTVAAVDVDGDGDQDLAVVDTDSTLSILSNAGNGTFAMPVTYQTGVSTRAFCASDLDGDGDQDLAVTGDGFTLSILQNNGSGVFSAPAVYSSCTRASSIIAADLDSDGDQDLAVAGPWGYSISVLANNGDGSFAACVQHWVGLHPYWVAASDLDGDGDLDLMVTLSVQDQELSILENKGNGTFDLAANLPVDAGPRQAFLSELNGDGSPDLAIIGNFPSEVVVFAIIPGLAGAGVDYAAGSAPTSVAAADLDGDGLRDVAAADSASDGISVLLNAGSGIMGTASFYAAGIRPSSIVAADLDRDGAVDLAVANKGSDNVSLLHNNGDGTFLSPVNCPAGSGPAATCVADLDADGYFDLAVANSGSNNVSVLTNNQNGTFASSVSYTAGINPSGVVVADVDRDGYLDLVVSNHGGGDVTVLINNGNATFSAAVHYSAGANPIALVAAQLTFDLDIDLAVANEGSNDVSILRNRGDGTFDAPQNFPADSMPASISAADLTGDGYLDLAITNRGSNRLVILQNDCCGNFFTTVNSLTSSLPSAVAVADFDVSGSPDLVIANSGDNTISIRLNSCIAALDAVDREDDKGIGSLRSAIAYANANPGPDTITFSASSFSLQLDRPLPPLSDLTGGTTILGLKPPGTGSPMSPGFEIRGDGNAAPVSGPGLVVQSSQNRIEGLVIGGLDGPGIAITGPHAISNTIMGCLFNNTGQGIDLSNDGPTPNDPGDADIGPNMLVNHPVFDSLVEFDVDIFSIFGTAPPLSRVELYAARGFYDGHTCPPALTNRGVSCQFIDSVSADVAGKFRIDSVPAPWPLVVEATATDTSGNTSEFSADLTLMSTSSLVVSNTADTGDGSLRWAILAANAHEGVDTITFTASGIIQPETPLPPLTDLSGGTVIDGFSAPGALPPSKPSVILWGYFSYAWGDTVPGLHIQSSNNRIVGLAMANFIGPSVAVSGSGSDSNTITRCRFYAHSGLLAQKSVPWIDIGNDGTTINDTGDLDSGPNARLNYPEFDSVFQVGADTFTVFGTAHPRAKVELYLAAEFGNPSLQPGSLNHGPAYQFLGSATADGFGKFQFGSVARPEWSQVTATATDSAGNTSEFSVNKLLTPDPLRITAYSELVPVGIKTSGFGALSPALQVIVISPANAQGKRDTIGPAINTFGSRAVYDSLTDWDGGGLPDSRVIIASPDTGTYRITWVLIGDPGSYLTGIGIDGHAEVRHRISFSSSALKFGGAADTSSFRLAPPTRGELNDDWIIDVLDVIASIEIVYNGAPSPEPADRADVNCDGNVDLLDIIHLISYAFQNGPAPCW
ncbi:MAG: VCBS repeat-containing protein [candidate division Zixibacteria bacterium]|nr:VCBS repeat-containing protein [candidate division Zixibacteria bacterium]